MCHQRSVPDVPMPRTDFVLLSFYSFMLFELLRRDVRAVDAEDYANKQMSQSTDNTLSLGMLFY